MQILDLPSTHTSIDQRADHQIKVVEVPGFNTYWGNILLLDFLFSHSKVCDANIAIIANSAHL